MRALNVFLCFVVSALIGLAVLEVGLRVLGMGPPTVITRFDPDTGWNMVPNTKAERSTSEYHVHYDVNALGLRDDPMTSPQKPAGTFRVLVLGDSFVQGYTVERRDLFVDLLEDWWKAEGRAVDVVNAGCEGWSTDQEVAWFERHGADFQPDVVLICPYENDVYWSGQTHYRRFQKPRYTPFGDSEQAVLQDPGPKPWFEHTAIGSTASSWLEPRLSWNPFEGHRGLGMELAVYFREPPSFEVDAVARVRGSLIALKHRCASLNSRLVMVPIPDKRAVVAEAREALAKNLRVPAEACSPDQPLDTFVGLARELGIDVFDPRAGLRAASDTGRALYFRRDFHLNPHGNHVLAQLVHDEFERTNVFPAAVAKTTSSAMPIEPEPSRLPPWALWFGGLWLALSTLYALTYKDEPWWKAVLGVGAMLAAVFTIAIGGGALLERVPPEYATGLLIIVVVSLLSFIAYKLGARLSTILELFAAFTRRGHWYLMPLVVVLLTVGSLLVVAASSPLIAPFIYTLF